MSYEILSHKDPKPGLLKRTLRKLKSGLVYLKDYWLFATVCKKMLDKTNEYQWMDALIMLITLPIITTAAYFASLYLLPTILPYVIVASIVAALPRLGTLLVAVLCYTAMEFTDKKENRDIELLFQFNLIALSCSAITIAPFVGFMIFSSTFVAATFVGTAMLTSIPSVIMGIPAAVGSLLSPIVAPLLTSLSMPALIGLSALLIAVPAIAFVAYKTGLIDKIIGKSKETNESVVAASNDVTLQTEQVQAHQLKVNTEVQAQHISEIAAGDAPKDQLKVNTEVQEEGSFASKFAKISEGITADLPKDTLKNIAEGNVPKRQAMQVN